MKVDQHRLSFQNQGWFRKQLIKANKTNRVSDWIGNKQLDIRKKTSILDGEIELNKFQLIQFGKELCKVKRHQRSGLQRKLLRLIIHELNFDFQNQQFIQFASKYLQYKFCPKGQILVKQGQQFTNLFILLDGRCQINSNVFIRNINGTAVFGQKQLLEQKASNASIKCLSDCQFFILQRLDYKSEKQKSQNLSSKSIFGVLKKNQIFRLFTQNQLQELCLNSEIINIQQKGDIIKQGKKHKYLYIIGEGQFSATQVINKKEKVVMKLQKFDFINFQGILDKSPILNIKNNSQFSQLYRLSLTNFLNISKQYPKSFKEFLMNKISIYKGLSMNKSKISPQRKAIIQHKNSAFKTFLSQIQDLSYHPPLKQSCTEALKTKVNLLGRMRNLSTSSSYRSGSIRSHNDSSMDFSYFYNNKNIDKSRNSSNEFMIKSFKQKLDTSQTLQLNVQNKLYDKSYSNKKILKQVPITTFRTAKMRTCSTFNFSQNQNKSEITNKKLQSSKSNKKDTQMLLRRVQMSSCRKRRNRTKIMFDPQDILNFKQQFTLKTQGQEIE